MWPTVSSAAEMMLEVGALTTMTPALVADLMSTLSSPTPARAMTLRFLATPMTSASTFVAERTRIASASETAERRAGRPVLEVGPEGVDGSGREFFGDQDDRLCHVAVP